MINKSLYYRFCPIDSETKQAFRRQNCRPEDEQGCAGILKDGLIMIDTDTDRDSELLMLLLDKFEIKCNIVSTMHGIHAIFKKPADYHVKSASKLETVTGIIVDVKQGRPVVSKSDIDNVKRFGKDMEIIQYCEYNDLDELPWQLRILTKPLNLQSVGEGCGRHQVHQSLIARYAAYTDDANEIVEWVNWVNSNVFDVPRESVNWTVKQVDKWLGTLDKTPISSVEDFVTRLQGYDISLDELWRYVLTNCDRR